MSSLYTSSLDFTGQQISIYLGIFIMITGVFDEFLDTIIFLSLRIFRQSSCALYLTVMSIVDIGQLLTGLLSRIMSISIHLTSTRMATIE